MFPNLCRTCLKEFQESSEIVPLFEPYKNIWYYRLINTTFRLSLTQNDQLGTNICKICAVQILKSYKFRLKYIETEAKLQKMLEQPEDVDETDDVPLSPLNSCQATKLKWKCNLCPASFATRHEYQSHRRLLHSNVVSDLVNSTKKSNRNMNNSWKRSKCLTIVAPKQELNHSDVPWNTIVSPKLELNHSDVSWNEPSIVIHDDDSDNEFTVPTITEVNVEIDVDQNDLKFEPEPEMDLGLYLTEKQNQICGFDPLDENNSNDSLLVPMSISPKKRSISAINKHWVCRICSEGFRTRDLLREHNHLHMAAKQISKPIPKCPEPKIKKVKLNSSGSEKVGKEAKWKCQSCDSAFITRDLLREHRRIHFTKRGSPKGSEFVMVGHEIR